MVFRDALLAAHIAAGSAGLLIGPIAMAAPKHRGWHTRAGISYQVAVAMLTVTALGLAFMAPGRLWPLALIAVATEAAALVGWLEQRRRRPGWLPRHVGFMAGSYVSFVTAALVVNWPNPLSWILPSVIGTPLIARAAAHAAVPGHQPDPRADARKRWRSSGVRCRLPMRLRAAQPVAGIAAGDDAPRALNRLSVRAGRYPLRLVGKSGRCP
jgi:hypothetical protein